MNGGLSDREQKLLAAGFLVCALAAVWFAVVAPVRAGFDARRDRRDAALSQIRHDQRLIAGGGPVQARLVAARIAAHALTLDARDPRLAERAAQLRIARAAAAAGVRLVATKAAALGPLVRVEADVRGDHASLAGLLTRLQGDAPQAQIDHWLEGRSDSFQSQASGAAILDAHLSLTYAYRPVD